MGTPMRMCLHLLPRHGVRCFPSYGRRFGALPTILLSIATCHEARGTWEIRPTGNFSTGQPVPPERSPGPPNKREDSSRWMQDEYHDTANVKPVNGKVSDPLV